MSYEIDVYSDIGIGSAAFAPVRGSFDANLNKPELKMYIDEMLSELQSESIATAEEVLRYYTSVLRGESISQVVLSSPLGIERIDKPPDEKEKLKAAEMLGKYHALFTDKTKVDGDMSFDIHIDYGDDEI